MRNKASDFFLQIVISVHSQRSPLSVRGVETQGFVIPYPGRKPFSDLTWGVGHGQEYLVGFNSEVCGGEGEVGVQGRFKEGK